MAQESPNAPLTRAEGSSYLMSNINNLLQENTFGLHNNFHYVPEEDLTSLLDLSNIKVALGQTKDPGLDIYILEHALKTFATLHVVFEHDEGRQIEAMRTFRERGFTDDTLSSETFVMCESNCGVDKKTCMHYFPRSRTWSINKLDSFAHSRWQFLVPYFDKTVFRYNFHYQQMLPWRGTHKTTVINAGNFSDVTCPNMIARHQNLLPAREDGLVIVAHKTLKPMPEIPGYNVGEEWIREVRAHEALNERSEHLIRGIGAYQGVNKDEKQNTYHLVLEWADGGNLLSFWTENPKPQLDDNIERSRTRVWNLLRQFCGLTKALECMHSGALSSQSYIDQDPELMEPKSPKRGPNEPFPTPVFDLEVTSDEVSIPEQHTEIFRSGTQRVSGADLTVPDPEPGNLTRRGTITENWRHGDIKPENILRFKTNESLKDSQDVSIRQYVFDGQQNVCSPRGVIKKQQVGHQQCDHDYQADITQNRSTDPEDETQLGTLKLADLGRARQHLLSTVWRMTTEKERFRTRWYEPPDLSTDLEQISKQKISRLFDIWSLGCVIFDGLLWMLYGKDAIDEFQRGTPTIGEYLTATPYWKRTGSGIYEITEAASIWMDRVLQYGQERSEAVADLVILLRERLLKVDLPLNSEIYTPGYRTNARDLREQLESILSRADQDNAYLFKGYNDKNARPLAQSKTIASKPVPPQLPCPSLPGYARHRSQDKLTPSPGRPQPMSSPGRATQIAQEFIYTDGLTNDWKCMNDQNFAEQFINESQLPEEDDDLCSFCKGVDIVGEEMNVTKSHLEANQDKCLLCSLLSKALKRSNLDDYEEIRLVKVLDSLVVRRGNKDETKILRLCCASDAKSRSLGVPLGAPDLCVPGIMIKANDLVLSLSKAWLDDCDHSHRNTCKTTHGNTKMPTRLIDVKNRQPKIIDSSSLGPGTEDMQYIAFSHKWGEMPEKTKTTKTNLRSRRKGIPLAELPTSFTDAIAVTKALGCRYLWIDCLCINQGDDGDFAEQATSMQTVFSNAYCVIAAASAEGATAGFWQRDADCNLLTSVRKGDVFISAVTNDFARDVLDSPLNRRGWVLQEHALARRTIFFTKNQMYWECGDGIRCETLLKLRHDVAGLLGDANFPSKTIQAQSTRGTQIHLWTRLFEQYSSLQFSYPEDRSVAMEGLMARLTTVFRTRSLYGVFESFWGRCLLWRRPYNGASLTRILPGKHAKKLPPTWSWMAVTGTITFVNPTGGEVYWNKDIILPSGMVTDTKDNKSYHVHPDAKPQQYIHGAANRTAGGHAITATAYNLTAAAESLGERNAYYDIETQRADGRCKVVIIGTSNTNDENKHHVLLVSMQQGGTATSYERVGVGLMTEACIDRESGIKVAIV